jgi:hypothetical protein
MVRGARIFVALRVGIATVMCAAGEPATAITAELAKKYRALAIKVHPYKIAGERGLGTAQALRGHLNECFARGATRSPSRRAQGKARTIMPQRRRNRRGSSDAVRHFIPYSREFRSFYATYAHRMEP